MRRVTPQAPSRPLRTLRRRSAAGGAPARRRDLRGRRRRCDARCSTHRRGRGRCGDGGVTARSPRRGTPAPGLRRSRSGRVVVVAGEQLLVRLVAELLRRRRERLRTNGAGAPRAGARRAVSRRPAPEWSGSARGCSANLEGWTPGACAGRRDQWLVRRWTVQARLGARGPTGRPASRRASSPGC